MKKIILFILVFSCICFSQHASDFIFSIATNSSGHIFAGTPGGVFRSTDNGNIWIKKTEMLNSWGTIKINSNGHIFVGLESKRLLRSINNGDSWTEINSDTIDNEGILSFALNSNGHIFAGTGGGVFKSTDNGDNWSKCGLAVHSIFSLSVNSDGYIFAGGPSGVYRSTNNGDDWVEVNAGLKYSSDLYGVSALSVNSTGIIFAGTNLGVFRSSDKGDNWTEINTGYNGGLVHSIIFDLSGNIYAGAEEGVFISTDNGDNWIETDAGLNNKYVYTLAINSNGDIYAGTDGGGIYKSTDNGNNWHKLNKIIYSDTNPPTYELEISADYKSAVGSVSDNRPSEDTNGNGILDPGEDLNGNGQIDEDTGIYEIKGGGTNINLIVNSFTPGDGIVTFEINLIDTNYIGFGSITVMDGANNDITIPISLGNPYPQQGFWEKTNGLANVNVYDLVINKCGYIFASTSEGIYRTSDNGDSWDKVSNNHGSLLTNKTGYIFLDSDSIYRSTDNGNSWTSISNGISEKTPITSWIINYESQEIWVGALYYVYDTGGEGSALYKSTDNGNTWLDVHEFGWSDYYWSADLVSNSRGYIIIRMFIAEHAGVEGENVYVGGYGLLEQHSARYFAFYSNLIYAITDIGIMRSTDNGGSWSENNNGLPASITTLMVDSSGYVYVGTSDSGIFRSEDNGESWTQLNSGLTTLVISSFVTTKDGIVFAGTYGGGVFRSKNSDIVPVELISFNGSVVNNSINLKWHTATETNNKGFEIERRCK